MYISAPVIGFVLLAFVGNSAHLLAKFIVGSQHGIVLGLFSLAGIFALGHYLSAKLDL